MIPAGTRAIFLDAVGTLIFPDPPAPLVYAVVGQRHGSRLTPPVLAARFRDAFQHEEERDLCDGLRTSEAREVERWRRIVAEVLDDTADPEACFQELFAHFALPEAWRCDPESGPVLAELAARGYELGLASNYDARLRSVASGLPELRLVRHRVISSEVGWRKPAAEFFHVLTEVTGLLAEQVLHVGNDRVNDCEGARRAGLPAILLDPDDQQSAAGMTRIRRLGELLVVTDAARARR